MAAGYYSISHALKGTPDGFEVAAKAIGVAITADGLDGSLARMTNTTSDFGREFDSLADVIAFGVAPAVLAWKWSFQAVSTVHGYAGVGFNELGLIASFFFLVCGAMRLARFNFQIICDRDAGFSKSGRKHFVGMPILAGAAVISAVVHYWSGQPLFVLLIPIWFGLLIILALLMVSVWTFYNPKNLRLGESIRLDMLALICCVFILLCFFSRIAPVALSFGYMLTGILGRCYAYVVRR